MMRDLELNIAGNVFYFKGSFQLNNVDNVIDEFRKAESDIIADLFNLQYLDSAGLGALIKGTKILKEKGYKLLLKNVRNHSASIIKITSAYKYLNILPDIKESLKNTPLYYVQI